MPHHAAAVLVHQDDRVDVSHVLPFHLIVGCQAPGAVTSAVAAEADLATSFTRLRHPGIEPVQEVILRQAAGTLLFVVDDPELGVGEPMLLFMIVSIA